MKAFNSNRLLQMAGGDIVQAKEFVEFSRSESYRQLGEVKLAIRSRDSVATIRAAISLKETLTKAGADRAADIASTVERMSRFEMLAAADSFYPLLFEAVDEFEQYATRIVDHKWWSKNSDSSQEHNNLMAEQE